MKNSWKDETPLTWKVFSCYRSVECGQELSLGCAKFKIGTKYPSLGWQWAAFFSVAWEKGWARDGNSSHHRRTEQKQLVRYGHKREENGMVGQARNSSSTVRTREGSTARAGGSNGLHPGWTSKVWPFSTGVPRSSNSVQRHNDRPQTDDVMEMTKVWKNCPHDYARSEPHWERVWCISQVRRFGLWVNPNLLCNLKWALAVVISPLPPSFSPPSISFMHQVFSSFTHLECVRQCQCSRRHCVMKTQAPWNFVHACL